MTRRLRIARDQLAAAQEHLASFDRYVTTDLWPAWPVGSRWLAEDRNWFWAQEVRNARLEAEGKPWTIEGPFAPGEREREMPADLAASWENLKRTGVSLANWDGPLEDF